MKIFLSFYRFLRRASYAYTIIARGIMDIYYIYVWHRCFTRSQRVFILTLENEEKAFISIS